MYLFYILGKGFFSQFFRVADYSVLSLHLHFLVKLPLLVTGLLYSTCLYKILLIDVVKCFRECLLYVACMMLKRNPSYYVLAMTTVSASMTCHRMLILIKSLLKHILSPLHYEDVVFSCFVGSAKGVRFSPKKKLEQYKLDLVVYFLLEMRQVNLRCGSG